MKISFAVTTHNEGEYVDRLLNQLTTHLVQEKLADEIVVLDDQSDEPTKAILKKYAENPSVSIHERAFNRDFAEHKNHLNSLCTGDFIFQVDADETFHPYLLSNLHVISESNPRVDLFMVPRVNTVDGLTEEHIKKWNWTVNDRGWVCWPDYQSRFYRNRSEIKWVGAVHERIRGFTVWSALPDQLEFALVHKKDIARQEKQNEMYARLNPMLVPS